MLLNHISLHGKESFNKKSPLAELTLLKAIFQTKNKKT